MLQRNFAFFNLSISLILYCPATCTSQTFRIIRLLGLAKQLIAHDAWMHTDTEVLGCIMSTTLTCLSVRCTPSGADGKNSNFSSKLHFLAKHVNPVTLPKTKNMGKNLLHCMHRSTVNACCPTDATQAFEAFAVKQELTHGIDTYLPDRSSLKVCKHCARLGRESTLCASRLATGDERKLCAQAELSLRGPSSFDGTSLGLHGLHDRATVP